MAEHDDDQVLALPTHDEAQTVLLHGILGALKLLRPGASFALDVIVDVAGSPQRLGGTNAPGVVRCVHNPSAGAVTVTIFDGAHNQSAPPLFSAQLAAGESRHVFLPFANELVATSGTFTRLFGEYRR